MEDNETQWNIIYVPSNNSEPHLTVLISMEKTKKVRDFKELLLKTLGKEHLALSQIAIATACKGWIYRSDDKVIYWEIAVLNDDTELTILKSPYAFEIISPPNGFKCVQCLQECDSELSKHIDSDNGRDCLFFMSDICMKNYFQKDAMFHICPVCNEEVTESSFIKTGTRSTLQLYNVPIILMHEKKTFGYPRLLKLPKQVYASDLFELVKQVVPQGKYALHKKSLRKVTNLKYAVTEIGCEIAETGQVCICNSAITVEYDDMPKISPPILHSIAAKQSQYPTSLFDTSQPTSKTNNQFMKNLLVNKLNPVENKVAEETEDPNINYPISSKNTTLQKTFEKNEDPKVDDPELSNSTLLTVEDPKMTAPIWPRIDIDREENSPEAENSKINVPTWMSDDFPKLQTTNKDRESEIGASNLPRKTFANSLNTIDTQTKIWEDYFGFQYEIDETDGKKYYKCTTERVWSLCSNQNGEQPFKIPYFRDLSIGKSFKSIYIDVNGNPVDYKILGPITITEQCGNELIIRTCASFRSSHYFISGQVLFMKSDDFFTPCGIITCSVPEENEYRYIISNYKQYTVCLSCEDEIDEIPFNEIHSSMAKDEDFDVRYWEQRVENEERILKYLNRNYEVVYTCCDSAIKEYDPMSFTWHWVGDKSE